MRSWKTSLFGLLGASGGAVLGAYAIGLLAPGDLPSWIKSVAILCSVIGPAGVGVFARDNNKTSEDVGLKTPTAFDVPISSPTPDTGITRTRAVPPPPFR